MIVTSLEAQKKDTSRISLYIDGLFSCGISANTLAKYSLYVGKEIGQETLDELFESELESRFFERAASFLTKSPKTEKQVKQYLKKLEFEKRGKWFDSLPNEKFEQICNSVVSRLKEYSLLDDEIYAELFVTSRTKNRPRGKDILIMELISKGVGKEVAINVVNRLVNDEYSLLESVYRKKYKEEKIGKEDRKKIDFLRRKGFNWDLIEQFINNESSK